MNTIINQLFEIEKKEMKIEIKDNGIGFNTEDIKQENTGVGLNNIFSRAKLINATVQINSIINQGTTITILLNSK